MKKPSKEDIEILESEGQYKIDIDKKKSNEPTYDDIPQYRIRLKLSEEQKERLTAQVSEEFESLIKERKTLGLDAKWSLSDNQYNGELKLNKKLNFNLHVHQSKIKEDAIVRALNEAFLDSEPLVDVSPRPGLSQNNGYEIADKQTEFIDFAMDEEIRPEKSITMINRSCVRKFVGIGKLEWDYKKERRKREEVYEGKWEVVMKNGQPVLDQNGQPALENKSLKEFLNNYQDAEKRYPNIVKRIAKEERVSLIVDYFDVISNNPNLKYIKIENFYVKNSTDYNKGLNDAHLIVERDPNVSWWDLKRKEANGEYENIEDIANQYALNDGNNVSVDKQELREYSVVECTTYFKMDEGDEEETKCKCWFLENLKSESSVNLTFLGAILYPYFGFDIDYIGFWVKLNDEGFYGGGRSVIADLRDSNIAQDALLNLYLHSIYIRNVLSPIVREGSDIEALFAEQRWTDGKPISVDATTDDVSKAFNFVQYPAINMGDFGVMNAALRRIDGDVSGVSDLMTGRENPADPRAPATKTIALLNQAGVNIKDYIRVYLPSFNLFVANVLQLYYQMSQESRKFKVRAKSGQVTGKEDIFADITRDQMAAKTAIQSRASSFAFDKMNEKQENQMMMQVLMAHPYAQQIPELNFKALDVFMKSFSPMWKSVAESMLPAPEEFKKQQMMVAMQAMQQVLQAMQQQQQISGAPPANPPQPDQLGDIVTEAQTNAFNPVLAQEKAKQQEK